METYTDNVPSLISSIVLMLSGMVTMDTSLCSGFSR